MRSWLDPHVGNSASLWRERVNSMGVLLGLAMLSGSESGESFCDIVIPVWKSISYNRWDGSWLILWCLTSKACSVWSKFSHWRFSHSERCWFIAITIAILCFLSLYVYFNSVCNDYQVAEIVINAVWFLYCYIYLLFVMYGPLLFTLTSLTNQFRRRRLGWFLNPVLRCLMSQIRKRRKEFRRE